MKLDTVAKEAGVSLVPDCGLAPGLVNSLGMYLMEQMDEVDTIKMYCGVLPQNPKPPFNYKLTFNVEGLVTEYDYEAVVLRDGKIDKVDTLADLEDLEIESLGKMEAFNTSGGRSTAPYTFEGKVKNYVYKTIRFPGHCERMRIFKDFGFWNESPVDVKGTKIVPKDVFNAVFGPALDKFVDRDMCAVRAVGVGKKNGQAVRLQVDILDKEDEATGFTSMERLTGFSLAIYAVEMAEGRVPKGAIRYEEAVTGTRFVEEIQKRGIVLKFQGLVLSNGDRGLLGLALSPHFDTDRTLFLYYTADPDSDGVDDEDDAWQRLVRVQISAADSNTVDPASNVVLFGASWADGVPHGAAAHGGGAIRFGRDGTLLVTTGDGAHYASADAGGLDAAMFAPGRVPAAEGLGAFRANDPGSLAGKVLRYTAAGGIPADNPSPTSVEWTRGLRDTLGLVRSSN